jgi:hypothetical protein
VSETGNLAPPGADPAAGSSPWAEPPPAPADPGESERSAPPPNEDADRHRPYGPGGEFDDGSVI